MNKENLLKQINYEEALPIYRDIGDSDNEARSLYNIGYNNGEL